MRRLHLFVILAAYIALGGLFATQIPAWQTPDEPAHYNYIRQLAAGQLPVIAPGDYNQKQIETQIAPPNAKPGFSLDALQYEDHQPPLFYALAVPVYVLGGGSLVALRLFALFIGGFAVLFAYLAISEIFPHHPWVAAFAAVLYALLPQHLHMLSALNNDCLAEALLMAAVWQSARMIRLGVTGQRVTWLAFSAGLGFLTKTTAYLAFPIGGLAVLFASPPAQPPRQTLAHALRFCLIALAFGVVWWARNLFVYGGTDVMGLQAHNAIVVGQPTTQEWLAQFGAAGLLSRLAQTTFQSFWGQFGWMSIVLDTKFYLAFFIFTALSLLLFVVWRGRATLSRAQVWQLRLMGILAGFTFAAFGWYNLQFIQHQGRYLFPALSTFALVAALGWTSLSSRPISRWMWLGLTLVFGALDIYLLARVILPAMR